MSQLDQLRREIDALRTEIAAEKAARLQDTAQNALAGKVKQPTQFVQVLDAAGLLSEQNGELQVRTSSGLRSLAEGVNVLLNEPGYSHFSLETRTTKETPEPEPEPLKYFDSDGGFKGDDSELLAALTKDQNGVSCDLAQLLQQRQSPNSSPIESINAPTQATPAYSPVQRQRSSQPLDIDDATLLKVLADPRRTAELIERSLGG
jgi:hypothetical protein